MSALLRRWLPLALVTLAAFWLRVDDLARRPMHADEANQAVKTGELLETGHYAFDPRDHHGPTLYYAAAALARLRGEHTLAELTETTLRLVPALAGTLAVLLLYAFAAGTQNPQLKTPAPNLIPLGAAAFLAVSPPAVYYSRDFIQETLLLAFTLGAFVCAQRWWQRPHAGWALATGACIGLAWATKASAPLFLVAGGAALVVARPSGAAKPFLRSSLVALAAALCIAALFYSSFFTHLAGLRDALAAYGFGSHRLAGGDTGHEKPWWYYLRLFGWQREGGLVFQQLAFSALALAGILFAWTKSPRPPAPALLRWATVYTLIVALVLSAIPYKTPWHAIHLVPGLALLAAGALAMSRRWPLVAAVFVVVLVFQFRQTRLTSFLRPADARNPYAYVHSSPDVLKLRPLAGAALARTPGGVIRVIGEEYWPIPWYLRGLPRVGYWPAPPADCDGALVIATATQAEAVRAQLHGEYHESILGLRPGVLLIVFEPRS
jgi:uncharacterized protein (TIGR03663 family)